jgi:hypothetical protein
MASDPHLKNRAVLPTVPLEVQLCFGGQIVRSYLAVRPGTAAVAIPLEVDIYVAALRLKYIFPSLLGPRFSQREVYSTDQNVKIQRPLGLNLAGAQGGATVVPPRCCVLH